MVSTQIDHAIAIPTRVENVWEQISDLEKNALWQADSEQIRYLTTMHSGRGTRWRNTSPDGQETVREITAWYDGIGYEYVIVDGVNFKENRGRIRLQEAPEGTIVQWTFTYEMTGFLSGVRNSLGTKRVIERDIIDSLRNLYNYIKHFKGDDGFIAEESRAYLKEAPDVEQRANYQPRHPSSTRLEVVDEPVNVPEPKPEQPTTDEDSRYRPPDGFEIPAATLGTPSSTSAPISEPPVDDDDTRPNPTLSDEIPAITDADIQAAQEQAQPPAASAALDSDLEEPSFLKDLDDPAPVEPIKPRPTTDSFWLPTQEEAEDDDKADTKPTRDDLPAVQDVSQPAETTPPPAIDAVPEPDKLDTSQVSVFDIFGIEKPSETQEVKAIEQGEIISPLIPSGSTGEVEAILEQSEQPKKRRRGLRAKLREQSNDLRLP